MTYVVFTRDELPNHGDHLADNQNWPLHEHNGVGPNLDAYARPVLQAQPIQGVFAIERADGTVEKCSEGYGFVYLDENDELRQLSLSQFEASYNGAEHVRDALQLYQ